MWEASELVMVLKPEIDWEGSSLPLIKSSRDAINTTVNQLRDPAIFVERELTYLLCSVRGKMVLLLPSLI